MKTKKIKPQLQKMAKAMIVIALTFAIASCSDEEQLPEGDTSSITEDELPIANSSRNVVTLQNPGFESGKDNWGDESRFSISSDERSGSRAAKVSNSSGRIEQDVNVTANTNYTLSAWVAGEGSISVGRSTIDFDTDTYTQVSIAFNSGNSDLITILGTRDRGDVRFDDFTLEFETISDEEEEEEEEEEGDDQTPPTGDYPFDVLGLDDWKITLPRSTDGDDRADEVYINANNNDDSSDPSFTVYEDEFFFVSDNGVTFSSPVEDGTPTTGNSSNTRSELREMPDDDDEDGWGASGSTVREMEFSARIIQTSSTKKLAFAQIHDFQESNWDDLIRIQIESDDENATVGDFGRIYVLGDMAEGLSSEGVPSQSNDDRTILENYRLGDWLDIRVTFNNDTIRIYLDGDLKQTYTGATCARNYFKAGVYNQSVNSSSTGDGIAEFRSLTVTENF